MKARKYYMLGLGYGSVPAEIAVAMFEVMLEQEELIDTGIRCERCGELTLPINMFDEAYCSECAADLERIAEETEAAIQAIEEVLETLEMIATIEMAKREMEAMIQRDLEEKMLDEIVRSLETVSLVEPKQLKYIGFLF